MSIGQMELVVASACLLLLTGCAEPRLSSSAPTLSTSGTTRPNAEPGSGNDDASPFRPQPSDPAALRHAWTRWQALNETNYDLTVRLLCHCQRRPALVTKVRDGKVVNVAFEGRPRHKVRGQGWTMQRLFQLLRKSERTASSVQVVYTQEGVPRRINIDSHRATADDETYYRVVLNRA